VNALGITVLLAGGVLCASTDVAAQGYRLGLDTRAQSVAYRGVTLDSVPDTAPPPNGYAVFCNPSGYCTFYTPGPTVHAAPITTTADLTLWGLGISGLSVRALGRVAGDLNSEGNWPGTDPHAQLLEAYAQYAAERWTAQLGRQTMSTRFGFTGFDGGRVTVRDRRRGLDLSGYAGWGLWRGAPLPVTSPALNPLDEFRPAKRTIVAGVAGGWTTRPADVRVSYEREVDPSVHYFVSERVGLDAVIRPLTGWSVTAGGEYDIAAGWWGSASAILGYSPPRGQLSATAGVRRYRPHFDLWTIWGAFSPVPYTAVDGSLAFRPVTSLQLRAQGEYYDYANSETATPLVTVESTGWRFSWGATYTLTSGWIVDAGYHAEFGPGASSRGLEGSVTYTMGDELSLTAHAATLYRPLEFRFDESSLDMIGLAADYRLRSRVRFQIDGSRYAEDRQRPDPAAFSWDQVRISARVMLLFGAGADLRALPPAVQNMPEKGSP